jgi:hypothetical protein
LLSEQIGFALQKENGIDESIVIQMERAADALISGAHPCLGERFPLATLRAHLEFQLTAFTAFLCALHAVAPGFIIEFQCHAAAALVIFFKASLISASSSLRRALPNKRPGDGRRTG